MFNDQRIRSVWMYHLRTQAAKKLDIALTLTLKQGILHENGMYEPLIWEKASTNVSDFLRRLDAKIYGNAAARHNKRLSVLTVIEGGKTKDIDKHLHVHMALQFNPRFDFESDVDHAKFKILIIECWSKTRWGYDQMSYTPCFQLSGWLQYLTKEGGDAIDLRNTYFGPLHRSFGDRKNV